VTFWIDVALLLLAAPVGPAPASVRLPVPIIRQTPEHCGPAALQMVLKFYAADSAALAEPERAYDPALRGALITDLAAAARRAGFDADVSALTDTALVTLLAAGVPPIALYQNGPAIVTVPHYAVIVGWDPAQRTFTMNDGTDHARVMRHDDFVARWRTAGCQALIVRRRSP
jgi:ABC-type bacteriocin/lantibiotic exporter with double-glycine peptidase domain